MKVVENSPWAGQLEAAQTIVEFIQDIAKGKKITISKLMDVGCAINTFLPSTKQLGQYMLKSKAGKKAMFKAMKKPKDIKGMMKASKAAGKKAFKN